MRRAWWVLAVFGVACGGGEFGKDFVWGSATAGFQVDMGCPTWSDEQCLDTQSDWYQWVTTDETINTSVCTLPENPSCGAGMWELFDVDRMSTDGLQGYRMSLEWSRLFPDGRRQATVEELATMRSELWPGREMFDALAAKNIHPMVTLNHYTMPFGYDGVACRNDIENCTASGWVNGERIIPLIALYSAFCAQTFGDQIEVG